MTRLPSQTPITWLDLPARVRNALLREGVQTVEELTAMERRDLLDLRYIGPGMVAATQARLAERGLSLRDSP